MLTIVFRSCDRVLSVNGKGGRVGGLLKKEVILGCLKSLLISARNTRYQIAIVDDHSSIETVSAMTKMVEQEIGVPFKLFSLDETTGNSASLVKCYELADGAQRDDLIYFCEDDYLHTKTAISEMVQAHEIISASLELDTIIYPCDYPDRYTMNPYPSYVLLGGKRHWRSILHTTGTLMVPRRVFGQYRGVFKAFSETVNERETINQIYGQVPCFSPITSLALHLHDEEHLSPFSDWRSLWNEISVSV